MFYSKVLCAVVSLAAATSTCATAQTLLTPIRAIPNADRIVVHEMTGQLNTTPFILNPAGNSNRLDVDLNGITIGNRDFEGISNNPRELYDVFLSDTAGAQNRQGPCLTIRADSTRAGANNIARVDLVDSAGVVLRSFDQALNPIYGGTSPVTGSVANMVDPDPTRQSWSAMGGSNSETGATLCFAAPLVTWSKSLQSPVNFALPGQQVTFQISGTITKASTGTGAGSNPAPAAPNAPAQLPEGTTLTFQDTSPAGLNLVSASAGPGWLCAITGAAISCNYTAPAGGSPLGVLPQIDLVYTVAPQNSGTITNCATVTPDGQGTQVQPQQSCASVDIRNIVEMHHYPVKYVCGFSLGHDPNPVGPVTSTGAFYTEINILNPDWREVDVFKTITPLVIEGDKAYREPDLSEVVGDEEFTMTGQTGTMDDCRKLGEMMGEDDLAMRPLDIGYLSIYATRPLDVTAVYTAMGVYEDQHNTALDIEQIEGRLVEILR